jgi:single-stranded-DNA-specific exonuclease
MDTKTTYLATNIPDKLESYARLRGCKTPEEIKTFFEKKISSDPFKLIPKARAIRKDLDAIQKSKGTVCLIGDYDCDGITSCAIFARRLIHSGCEVHTFIPRRDKNGYGFSSRLLKEAISHKPELILVLDSGTQEHSLIDQAAKSANIWVIDHHDKGEVPEHPKVFNPKYFTPNNIGLDLQRLCTAGLAYMLLEHHRPDVSKLSLTLAALGTVADIVPLLGLNRGIVFEGLENLNQKQFTPLLLKCISEEKNIKEWTSRTFGFQIAPLINACGRLNQPMTAFHALMTTDLKSASEYAVTLINLNNTRKEQELIIREEALEQAEKQTENGVIVVYKQNWHPGIIGIVASHLSGKYNRPALVLAWEPNQEQWTGSGRSPQNSEFNLGNTFHHMMKEGKIIKGGGHAQAAGLSISPSQLPEALKILKNAPYDPAKNTEYIEIAGEAWDMKLPEWLTFWNKLEPFGQSCPEPFLLLPPVKCEIPQELKVNAPPHRVWAYKTVLKYNNEYTTLLSHAEDMKVFENLAFEPALAKPEMNPWKDKIFYQLKIRPFPK